MTKFNANMTELTERISIAMNESRKKHLTGDKQTDYIIARVWQLGEQGYDIYKANRAKQAAAKERMATALAPAASAKANKPTAKANKPTATSAKTTKAKATTASAKATTNTAKEVNKA